MAPTWVIQTNAVSRDQAQAVSHAVERCGGKFLEVAVLPATNTIDFLTATYPETLDLIPYGSTKLVELAMERVWAGVFRNTNFSVPKWNEARHDMLNRDSVSIQVQDIAAHMTGSSSDTAIFIRPTIGKKLFPGQTATVAEVANWLKEGRVGKYLFKPETEVTIARTKQILSETRWFVVDGKVIDGSTYRLRGQSVLIHDINESHVKEAQRFADIWLPHPTCVMDLAETKEGTRVVEFNTFNSSGFYHHDIPKIIKAVHKAYPNL